MSLNILSRFIEQMVIILQSDPQPSKSLPTPTYYSNPSYQSSDASIAHESRYQINLARSKLQRMIYRPNVLVQKKIQATNQKLMAKGLPPLAYEKTMRELENISNQPNLTPQQKKNHIENLRKQLGLSKKEMKNLFTKPLAKAHQETAEGLKSFLKSKDSQLNQELSLAERVHGKNSPQAQAVQRRIRLLKASLEPEIDRNSEKSKFFSSMYPSFWSRLKGVFKKIGQGILKGASIIKSILRKIPFLLKTFKPFISMIPGFGSFAGIAISGMEAIMKVFKK